MLSMKWARYGWWRKLSSPRGGLKGPRAEHARAVTGRWCPRSGVGQDFLPRRRVPLTETAVREGFKTPSHGKCPLGGTRALWFWIFLEFQYGQADSSVCYRNSKVWPYTGLWRLCWNPPRNYTRVRKILQWQKKRMFSLLPTFLR